MTDEIASPTAPESLPNYLADGLPKQNDETLEDVRDYVDELLEERRRSVAVDELPDGAEPIEDDEQSEEGTLVKERVKCGSSCTCNNGNGHGPYLYLYKRVDGKLTSEYVGKP